MMREPKNRQWTQQKTDKPTSLPHKGNNRMNREKEQTRILLLNFAQGEFAKLKRLRSELLPYSSLDPKIRKEKLPPQKTFPQIFTKSYSPKESKKVVAKKVIGFFAQEDFQNLENLHHYLKSYRDECISKKLCNALKETLPAPPQDGADNPLQIRKQVLKTDPPTPHLREDVRSALPPDSLKSKID